ncbi:nuclear transport factor 2 family protein [Pseudoduganella sp.]|uniref:nuclear transport factor 2 family protein n=1 Tax=Pseudoduganella sp. TaxID=1880898 RepID=UPI0035B0444C
MIGRGAAFAAGLGLVLASAALAQSPREVALQVADSQWNTFRLQGDAKSLAPLLADRWVLTHSDGKVQFKADYLSQLGTGSRRNTSISNEDVTVELHGDTAIVTGKSVQSGVGEQGPFSGTFRFTRTWRWQDGRWVMLASHSSRLAP